MNLEYTCRTLINDNSKFIIIDNKKIIEALERLLQLIEYGSINYQDIIFDIEYLKPDYSFIAYILKNEKEIIYNINDFLIYLPTRY
ncbi:hypothetical protein [Brachyspira pulli]|uniref:hypothetical protein n=1 Tax=Brachyspira pulli TaxID=310721 RepID=UPI003004F5F3